jgi:hypothetical protein
MARDAAQARGGRAGRLDLRTGGQLRGAGPGLDAGRHRAGRPMAPGRRRGAHPRGEDDFPVPAPPLRPAPPTLPAPLPAADALLPRRAPGPRRPRRPGRGGLRRPRQRREAGGAAAGHGGGRPAQAGGDDRRARGEPAREPRPPALPARPPALQGAAPRMAARLRRPRPGGHGIAHAVARRADRLRQDLRRLASRAGPAARGTRRAPALPHGQGHGPAAGAAGAATPRQAVGAPRLGAATARRARGRRPARRPGGDPPQLGPRRHRPAGAPRGRLEPPPHPRDRPPGGRAALGHHQGDARARRGRDLRLQLRLLAPQPRGARERARLG